MDHTKKPLPFAAPANTPIVGQPFTFTTLMIPVTATLTCNCGPGAADDRAVTIVLSQAGTCPRCGRTYNVGLNPTTMKLEIAMGEPAPKDPS